MNIQIIKEKIDQSQLSRIINENFGDMVKGVIDLKQGIIALGGELHADAEALLLEEGSLQEDLWGFNIYADKPKPDRIVYSSFINIRPSQGNRSMEIKDQKLQAKIKEVIDHLIE